MPGRKTQGAEPSMPGAGRGTRAFDAEAVLLYWAAAFRREAIGGEGKERAMLSMLCVGAGGFVGAVARYLLGLVPYEGDFPLMTFIVNFAGAVAIGAVVEAADDWPGMPEEALLFLKTGLCGGFTTFSTFSLETLALLEDGRWGLGALYAGGSLAACLVGVLAGRMLMRGARAILAAEGM